MTQNYHQDAPLRMSTRDAAGLAEAGDVLVCDFGGNREISNLGANACRFAQQRGVAATIVHGAVRDADSIRAMDYAVWASGVTPITGKFRLEAVELNGPVALHNVTVNAGDLMVADSSGVCVIPLAMAGQVIELARKIS